MTVSFATALDALDARLAEAQKSADVLARSFRRLRQAAKSGHVTDIERGLLALPERAAEADRAVKGLAGAWGFDARGHLTGGYREELTAAAAAAGVRLIEKDGRLYAFPIVMKLEPAEPAVKLGRKRERGIRPSRIAGQIAALQKRPQRLPEQRFLDLLYSAYQLMAGAEWRTDGPPRGPVLSLAEIHGLLTLLPGSDYPIEEFGRDLLLLDRKPDLTTKDGNVFEFPGSSLARRVPGVTVYDENGSERTFIGLRFSRGGR